MRQAYVFDGIAVIVGPWHEPMDPPERGTRVELRLLENEPKRGSFSAAERVVLDQPVFRADLFDQTNAAPGNLRAAHCHLGFDGIEPTDRVWDDAIQEDAAGWLDGAAERPRRAARAVRRRRVGGRVARRATRPRSRPRRRPWSRRWKQPGPRFARTDRRSCGS